MFLDASAMVAMLTDEEAGAALAERLAEAPSGMTSAIAVFETVAALMRKRSYSADEAREIVHRFLRVAAIEVTAIGEKEGEIALKAFERFGKGRHPAALNMGDCFAYGCAQAHGVALLFTGDDFPQTDIAQA